MRKEFLIFVIAVLILSTASASFTLSDANVNPTYGPGEVIKGWVNLSLLDEEANSVLSGFNDEISIINFLKNNSLIQGDDFSCSPSDCKTSYKDSNREETKTYSLNSGDKKTIGLLINGYVESVDYFSMDIQSDAGESGYPQLFVDVLDDWLIEWQAYEFSGSYGDAIWNCYNKNEATELAEITQTEYCQRIGVPLSSKVKIGAEVTQISGGEVDFEMRIYNDEEDMSCTASASGTGQIDCEVNMQVKKAGDFSVCIRTKDYNDNNKYGLYYEQNQPCGFSGESSSGYDFPIFVHPGKYVALGGFSLNQEEIDKQEGVDLTSYIENYISERYNNDCNEGCIIPIKIISGTRQTIDFSNVQLGYTSGVSKTERYLNDLSEEPAKVNMDFQVLDLEKSGITVPTAIGKRVLSLKLGGEEILQRNIEVLKVGRIDGVFPLDAAAAVPVKFSVSASGNISEYIWDFGDGTEITTTENFTYHTYPEIGTYELRITVINEEGKATRTFSITVLSPERQINESLKEKRIFLEKIKASLNDMDDWHSLELEKEIKTADIESMLNELQRKYDEASNDEDYVSIMSSLYKVRVPEEIQKIEFSGDFLPFPENIDPSYLNEFGYEADNPGQYSKSIIVWMANNLNLELDSIIFDLKYPEETTSVFTAMNLKITPVNSIDEAYLIIQKETVFKEDYGQAEFLGGAGIELSDLKEQKTIEFIIPGKVEAIGLPLYISPDFSELPQGGPIGPCDNDGICEKDIGENEDNCANDCHKTNWLRIILWLGILLGGAFILYIILQEWYKRYYEKHLFKSREELYNVMSFIYNALKQGTDKKVIYARLKEYKWNREQIVYAFKKLLGKRTGMWEIPIFKAFEKRKIRKELAKRKVVKPVHQLQKI